MRRETGTRTWSFRPGIVALSMGVVSALSPLAPAWAQKKSGPVRQVRVVEAAKRGFPSPGGVAYSPRADALVVFGADPQQVLLGSELRLITMGGDPRGSVRLATITDPRNLAIDAKAGRLLILEARQGELIAIPARPDGNLDPARQVRFAAEHLGVVDPRGLTVDPASGRLFVLDRGGPWLLRIEPDEEGGFDTATVTRVDLGHLGLSDPRGLAFDPTTGHLHVLSGAKWTLYELTEEADLVATRDLSGLGLFDPRGMVFAPSGDTTDDPVRVSVYIADAGRRGPRASTRAPVEGAAPRSGGIVELSLIAAPEPAAAALTSNLVATTLTSAFNPPSPDPSGIAYLPASGTLWVCDGEVEEMPIFAGVQVWETTLGGGVLSTHNVQPPPAGSAFSNEPVGVTVNPANRHLFYSDDDVKKVFEADPGTDGLYHTGDDVVTSFSTLEFGSGDPEDILYDPSDGVLFVDDGVNAEIYRVSPGTNGVFDGVTSGDDVFTQFDTSVLGITDPEGITLNGDNGNLYIVGNPVTVVAEITKSGTLVRMIDISAANAVKPAGLAYAPGSLDPSAKNLYIVDRGVDNIQNPSENDGKMYEMTTNQAPVVSAGPDLAVTLPSSAALDGAVSDDGLPNPPAVVTTTWSQLSGPGTVSFTNANAVDTTASFSAAGTYVLRLTADDSALSSSDDVTLTVNAAGQLSVTQKGAIHSPSDAISYSFAPVTASNDRLYVVFVSTSIGTGTAPAATSVSGAGLTFTEIGTAGGLLYSASPGVRRIQAWRALVGSGAATGSIAISLGGTSTGMDAVLLEFSGMDTSGTNGSGAVVQSATNQATGASALTVTLSAFASASNRPVAFFNHRAAEATTEKPGYTELDDALHSAPAAGAECEWNASTADTTPSASWLTLAAVGGFALEIKAGP